MATMKMCCRVLGRLPMKDMVEAPAEEIQNVVVVQAVKNLPAVLAGAHEAHLAQAAQLVGDGRFAETHGLSQRADAHLCIRQGSDDADSARVGQGLEQFSHVGGHPVVEGR